MAGFGNLFTPAPIGNGSGAVNGQLLAFPMNGAFYPSQASAPFYKGQGQPPPTVPINYMQSGGDNQTAATTAAANPFSFSMSPLIIAVLALVVGILGLRHVHWR